MIADRCPDYAAYSIPTVTLVTTVYVDPSLFIMISTARQLLLFLFSCEIHELHYERLENSSHRISIRVICPGFIFHCDYTLYRYVSHSSWRLVTEKSQSSSTTLKLSPKSATALKITSQPTSASSSHVTAAKTFRSSSVRPSIKETSRIQSESASPSRRRA